MARARTKKIDNVFWGLSSGIIGGLGVGTSALNFFAVGTQPSTLLRMRGEMMIWADAIQTGAVAALITFGVIKVPEGTGTTVVYTPVSDSNAPWILYGQATIAYEEYVADVIDCPLGTAARIEIDNKAMRRIRPDEELQLVAENTSLLGSLSVNLSYSIRSLQGF